MGPEEGGRGLGLLPERWVKLEIGSSVGGPEEGALFLNYRTMDGPLCLGLLQSKKLHFPKTTYIVAFL